MLSCNDATKLMSQSQDKTLTLKQRTRLKLHLLMCSGCTNFNKQMNIIHKAMQRFK